MKITDLAIIAFIVLLPFSLMLDTMQKNSIAAENYREWYTDILHIATEDATKALLSAGDADSLGMINEDNSLLMSGNEGGDRYRAKLNLDYAIKRYYETLYINLNMENDKAAQEGFRVHTPVQLVVDYDGYYIHSWQDYSIADSVSDPSKKEVKESWQPKKAYSYYDQQNHLVINFTLDNFVYVYQTPGGSGNWEEGKYVLKDNNKSDSPTDINIYKKDADGNDRLDKTYTLKYNLEAVRRQTIADMIRKDLEFYTNQCNRIAQTYGLGYGFHIPMKEDDWNNIIHGVGFISFIQGLPVKGLDAQTINTFGFGGSKVVKGEKYDGKFDDKGVLRYHKETCDAVKNGDYIEVFDNRKDAAKGGYYPCPTCRP